jgi:1-acyl-sn-glycerol-3-phosphate acyltransferase
MPKFLDQVQPDLEFLAPHIEEWLLLSLRSLLPWYLRWSCHISKIDVRNLEQLAKTTEEFRAGKTRYILAFRHPTIDDQFAMFHLMGSALPKSMGIDKFSAYYVYDRGIPLWAGEIITYLYPRTGGIPIHRGKLDRQGLQAIRKFLVSGEYPVAISPEGGTNGHSEKVAALEPGVVQIGFWGCEDLAKAGRQEQVVILPVGIQYEYVGAPWGRIDRLLMDVERECGLSLPMVMAADRYDRLVGLGEYLLKFVEGHYKNFYPDSCSNQLVNSSETRENNRENQNFGDRLEGLLDQILQVAESNFGIKSKGTLTDRSRRLEQAGWDRIFRPEISNFSILERGFANQVAKEANMSQWHLRIAESLTAITGDYVQAHPSPTRFAEILLLIWRSLSRVKNQPFGKSPYLGDRSCLLTIGEPIVISDYFAKYQSSRAEAKECVANLTMELQMSLEKLIQLSTLG